MKSYTNIEQSKTLAKILPLESADMFCADVTDKEKETHSYNFHILSTWGCTTFEELKDRENKFVRFIPVWSLAALIGLLPNGIDLHKSDNGRYFIGGLLYDNLLDACYDRIIILHEQKLL